MTKPGYEISLDPARIQLDVVHRLLAASYWSPRVRRDMVELAMRNSIVVGAYHAPTGLQVGYARCLSDRATIAYLCDVIVEESHRARGVGQLMINALHEHPDLQLVRRWALATRDAHTLYERYGYTGAPANRWMERKMPNERWQEPS